MGWAGGLFGGLRSSALSLETGIWDNAGSGRSYRISPNDRSGRIDPHGLPEERFYTPQWPAWPVVDRGIAGAFFGSRLRIYEKCRLLLCRKASALKIRQGYGLGFRPGGWELFFEEADFFRYANPVGWLPGPGYGG